MSTKYPIGIQNFEKLRKDGYLYIDKTALMYQLVDRGSYYFLSRPRRFGKRHDNFNDDINQLAQAQDMTKDVLVNIDYSSTNPIPMIYQNGYLTIKDYDREFRLYSLGFPYREVEEGFKNFYQNKKQQ